MPNSPIGKSRLWLFIGIWVGVILSTAQAQQGEIVWWPIAWDALKPNRIGDSGLKTVGVYLPPSYRTSERRYPVIYVLHGFGGDERSLSNKVKTGMDDLIQRGEIGEMIAVFANGSNRFGGSQYLSSSTIGDYETYIVKDLVAFIDRTYRTLPHRNSRGITGFSMGGYGSMRLALKYPDVYSVVVAQAGTYDFSDFWVENFVEVGGVVITLGLEFFPENRAWELFDGLPLPVRNGIAYLAGVSPNPDKPPFFLDLPYEVDFPAIRRIDAVFERIAENDVIHALDSMLQGQTALNGIKLVHGNADETAFVRQARALDAALTARGVEHQYLEHTGEHTFIAEESLTFLSQHLAFESPPFAVTVAAPSVAVDGSGGHEIRLALQATRPLVDGELRLMVPQGWTPPQRTPNAPGYTAIVDLSPDVRLAWLAFSEQTYSIGIGEMQANDRIEFAYGLGGGNSGAVAGERTQPFTLAFGESQSGRFETLTNRLIPITSADGSGTATIFPRTAVAHSAGNEITIQYTATGRLDGGQVVVRVPHDWTPPQNLPGVPGYTTVTSTGRIRGILLDGQRIQITLSALGYGETVTVTYGSGGGASGAVAPPSTVSTFTVSTSSGADGELTLIRQSPLLTVVGPDVNADGTVNILDLTLVGSRFGQTVSPREPVDVNWDGLVNIFDLVIVGNHFGQTFGQLAAPTLITTHVAGDVRFENLRFLNGRQLVDVVLDTPFAITGYAIQFETDGLVSLSAHADGGEVFSHEDTATGRLTAVKLNSTKAWQGRVNLATLAFEGEKGHVITVKQADFVSDDGQLYRVNVKPFTIQPQPYPDETRLLANFPNPFNPETWIPFQLRESADVRILIYDSTGNEVRRLVLGEHRPGYYTTRDTAAYWDGRNQVGEFVASGVYFYRLEADDRVSVRSMVVLK